jgi:hypothetical protein
MLLTTTMLTLIGWILNPLIRLTLPNLNLSAMQNLWFSNAASCISNLGMFVTPIVMYIFRLESLKKSNKSTYFYCLVTTTKRHSASFYLTLAFASSTKCPQKCWERQPLKIKINTFPMSIISNSRTWFFWHTHQLDIFYKAIKLWKEN